MAGTTTTARIGSARVPDCGEGEEFVRDDGRGMAARVRTRGARLLPLRVPDRDRAPMEVVLGHDPSEEWAEDAFLGATVGRCANRIARGRFELAGRTFLDGSRPGRGGAPLNRRTGLCLETHRFPDAPNRPEFPSVVLRPGETFRSSTLYRFCVAAFRRCGPREAGAHEQ